jgi:predicted transcriptional regulator YdeE
MFCTLDCKTGNLMEDFILNEDINVYCVTAKSFPDKVLQAHQTLHSLIDFNPARRYFGLSRPDESRKIIYKAAAEELNPGELSKHQLEVFTILKGTYHSILVNNFRNHVEEISKAFQEIIALDTVAPDGICLEWYLKNDDVRCMVRQRKD